MDDPAADHDDLVLHARPYHEATMSNAVLGTRIGTATNRDATVIRALAGELGA